MKGTSEASTPTSLWRSIGFEDTGFSDSSAPFWYGDTRPGGTQLTDMQGGYSCVFLRHEFVITDASMVVALDLSAYVDDGFVAWINGTEVQRVNMNPGEPTYDSLGVYNGNQPDPAAVFDYPLPAPAGYLVNGTNVLTVQAFNTSLGGSSDFGFDCQLEATITETVPPEVSNIAPAPGTVSSLNSITVTFTEAITSVDGSDLRVNGGPAIDVSGSGATYTFTFNEPAAGAVSITWGSNHGITDLATPGNPFDETAPSATWSYTLVDITTPTVSALHPPDGFAVNSLSQIEVTFSEPVANVQADDLLINGAPATNVTFSGGPYVFRFPEPATGTVNVAWAPGHGITDTAVAPNAFVGGLWSYTLDPNLPTFDLAINEFLAANVSAAGLADEDGEQQDWIEIYNQGTNSVNLANWALSDDPALPGLWAFPARTLNPGQYLVVFASGKDRKPTSGELHTNFKLAGNGEHLGLYSPDSPRLLASGFDSFPEQRNDVSFGTESPAVLRYFATPTPGGPNGTSTILGVVAPVHVNVERGHFTTPFTLVLSCATPGATLRYTTDGSEPTATSPVFPPSLNIADTTLFRSAGFKADYLPSKTTTHSYFFNVPEAIRSLPTISIVTDDAHLTGPNGIINPANFSNHGLEWERPTSVEWIEPEDNSGFQINCGIRLQGSDYHRDNITASSKFSFRLYFRGDYGAGRLKYPLFPLTSVDRFDGLVLRGGFNEQEDPFIRDEIHRRLSSDMGQIATHGNMAIVFINGEYYDNPSEPWKLPVYNPCERVHEEFFQEHLGGSDEWDVTKPFWNSVVDGTWDDFESMLNYLRFTADVTDPTDYTTISQWLDLTNYVDYALLNTYAGMGDWPNNNWRAGKDRGPGGIWRFCMWDAEWGMGIYDQWVDNNLFTLSGGGPYDSGMAGNSPIGYIYQNLTGSDEFKLLWADRVQKHFYNAGVLTAAHITNRFRELEAELSQVIPGMDTEILDWADQRRPIYFGHMSAEGLLAPIDAPTFSQHGGRVPVGFNLTMTTPSGTIYYTTDGSDPRVRFTGAISGSATAYSSFAINSSVTVKTRAKQGNDWSALTEATFTYASLGSPLRITEIMYNPIDGSIYEFIELENTSGTDVDLSGMYLEGITFTFLEGSSLAAGDRLVLGSNTDTNSWKARYTGVTALGWFAGNLSNGGERIELFDSQGRLITSVDYNDGGGWPEAADGNGNSLEVLDPNADPDDPANWQASATVNGTPSNANSAPPAQPVYLNEVMAFNLSAVNHSGTFPDWVELRNPSGSPVSIADWSLTDDGNERKYVFPAGTTVPANGYLVIWCDSATNTAPGLHAGFNLDNDGESLSLYNSDTNRVDAMSFGLQIVDASVGRISGDWALNTPTPNAVNSAASLGSVSNLTINEWMADPLAGNDDWIEVYNSSAILPVSLKGIYLATINDLHHLTALSFIRPQGHVQLRADHGVGPDHLDFNLSAAGDQIVLFDNTGGEMEKVIFNAQTESVSEGRLPDGNANMTSFPGTASPAAANYTSTYNGPVINELLARNQSVDVSGQTVDYVEIRNASGSAFDLSGMSLSVNSQEPGELIFPAGTTIGANSYLVIQCDGSALLSTNGGNFNMGESLDGESGGAYLFNSASQLVDSVQYGLQIRDQSIGLFGGEWKLSTAPTPGLPNASAATLGTVTGLHLNEWMANEAGGADWFEIYNPSSLPVDLSGASLSDDPSIIGEGKFQPAPLSFIAANGFVKWVADANPGEGLNHVNFGLNGQGDSILIYRVVGANYTPVDAVAFGAQSNGVSEGSIPDGDLAVVSFPASPTPAESNYRLLMGVEINEILTHTDPPLEDAIELHNPTGSPLDVSGWYLSNDKDNFTKYEIPGGTIIPARGYAAFYEYQFNDGSTNAFALNSAHGDQVWLSKAPGGVETYDRVVVSVGATFNGVPLGLITTSVGVDYAPLLDLTFGVTNPTSLSQFRTGTGALNASPIVGPVIINEILYNPPGGTNGGDEYVELFNNSGSNVLLYDPVYSTNHWKLGGGLDFTFPAGASIAGGEHLLVVEFDPLTNPTALADFRSRYSISTNVSIYGPFSGKLNNDEDSVELYQPDTPQSGLPDAGFVPYIRVDHVNYTDTTPWPAGHVDGGGLSLQRIVSSAYGNEPLNWLEAEPTPGAPNNLLLTDTDRDGIPDLVELDMGLNPDDPTDGADDEDLDGLSNYGEYVAGTNHKDPNSNLKLRGSMTTSTIVLSFDAVADKTYSVLYKDSLMDSDWMKLADVPAQTVNQSVSLTNALSGLQTRLYRVTTPTLP